MQDRCLICDSINFFYPQDLVHPAWECFNCKQRWWFEGGKERHIATQYVGLNVDEGVLDKLADDDLCIHNIVPVAHGLSVYV